MPKTEIKIDLIPEAGRPSFRTKDVCLTVRDWLDVGAELKERYPQAVYVRRLTPQESFGTSLPSLRINHQLSELLDDSGGFAPDIKMGFDPNHRLDLKPASEATDWRRGNFGWVYNGMCLPSIRLMPGGIPCPADEHQPEHLASGRIEMSLAPKNQTHLALAQQVFGILRRHITKQPMHVVHFPDYKIHLHRKGGLDWIGKDALRWAREDPKRLLKASINPDGTGWGYRPADG